MSDKKRCELIGFIGIEQYELILPVYWLSSGRG